MIPLQKFKDVLGEEGKDLTEEEILKLKDQMEKLAEVLFDMWLREINPKNKGKTDII